MSQEEGPAARGEVSKNSDETTTRLDLLPAELIPSIAIFLDPDSLVSLMDSSGIIRDHLESDSAFWSRMADEWRLPKDSVLRSDELDDELTGRRTVADRVAALRENFRKGKCSVWRCDVGDPEPKLEEKNGRNAKQVPHCGKNAERYELYWNEHYVLARNRDSSNCIVWNTRPKIPVRHPFVLARYGWWRDTVAMWRQYLLIASLTDVTPSNELQVLKIFDLEGDGSEWKSVFISALGALRSESSWDDHGGVVRVLETSAGEAKAVVTHRFFRETVLIVSIPEGTLERRIHLPIGVRLYDLQSSSICFRSCLVFDCEQPNSYSAEASLTLMATSKTKTFARLARFKDLVASFNGNCSLKKALPDGTIVSTRLQIRNSLRLMAFTQAMTTLGEAGNSNSGDLYLELHETEEPKAELRVEEPFFGELKTSGNVILFNGRGEKHVLYAAKYSSRPMPTLELMYKVQLPIICDLLLFNHRFLVMESNEADWTRSAQKILKFYDVNDGKLLGQKYFKRNGFKSPNRKHDFKMGETDVCISWSGHNAFFYLFKYA